MKVLHLKNNNDLIEYLNSNQNINDEKSGYSVSPNFTQSTDHILIKASDFKNFLSYKNNLNEFKLGNISLRYDTNKVKIKNKIINLSKKEHQLLLFLMKSYPRIVKKEVISIKLWQKNYNLMSNTLEVHLNRLRKKIGKEKITCIKGFGYKLNL